MDDAARLHSAILAQVEIIRGSELHLANLLREMEACSGYLNYATSMRAYAENFLGLFRGKGGDLLRIGRALPNLPLLEEAMGDGRVPWTKARAVVQVATPETEEVWIERAESWTVEQLARAVKLAKRQLAESDLDDDAPVPPDEPPPVESVIFKFELDPESAQLVKSALALLRARAGEDEQDSVEPADLLVMMAEQVVAKEAPEQGLNTERLQTIIRRCPDCDRAEQAGLGEQESAEVTEAQLGRAACDSVVVSMLPGEEGSTNKTVSDRVRRIVLERDHYRCTVPRCKSRLWLELHHVVHQEHGGPHSVANLVATCYRHHTLIHEGRLHVEMDSGGLPVFDWPRIHRPKTASCCCPGG